MTARAIAINCNIIRPDQVDDERCCMAGPEFYEKMGGLVVRNGQEEVGNFKAFKELMPYMRVMARSRPEDKYLMVFGLRQMGHTVAVTGVAMFPTTSSVSCNFNSLSTLVLVSSQS